MSLYLGPRSSVMVSVSNIGDNQSVSISKVNSPEVIISSCNCPFCRRFHTGKHESGVAKLDRSSIKKNHIMVL